MKYSLVTRFLAVLIFGSVIAYNWSNFKRQNEPVIYSLHPSKELVAVITGDPEYTIDTASLVFHSSSKILKLSPSYFSGRYEHVDDRLNVEPKYRKIAYTRPAPETLGSLGKISSTKQVDLKIQRREALLIAELRHIGPYETVPEGISKLIQFIKSNGYKIADFYEEVYILFEKNERDPKNFETLLRIAITPSF